MYLIVGLGNPGRDYVNTRHNVGFEALDVLASYHDIELKKVKFHAILGEGKIGSEKVILAKPQTYMNQSGQSVREITDFYKIAPENVIVIFDDIAFPVGKMRIKPSGSSGGHNGMKSIIYHLGSDKFPRIRLGIGGARGDLADHVLGKFTKEETVTMIEVAKKVPDIVSLIINGKIEDAMTKYNRLGSEE